MKQIGMLDLAGELAEVREPIRAGLDAVLDSRQFVLGPQVEELERRVSAFSRCRRGVGVSSGTDALLCALMAAGVGSGDEVITTPFTFFATAGCIRRLGARPVFVDIEEDTFNIDVSQIPAAITPRTRAIIPVHLFGQCADMDEICVVADHHDLVVIEDVAQAIGATYRGRRAGSLGAAGCLSFYPTKNLGGFGEGGMIITNDQAFADRCVLLRNHGQSGAYRHEYVGGNFRLDAFQAVVLLVKMDHLEAWNAARQANADRYTERLVDVPVRTPQVRDYNVSVYHQYSILCDRRDALREHLRGAGVGCGVYYPMPLHLQPCFADLGYTRGDFRRAERAADRILCLPVHPMLKAEDVDYVAECIAGFYRRR
ncbi:MAG: DegT/DnrJ/EryC1/StrS family aminotransferase [Phycisphaerales bacterium]|nr:MAG: DegT/DnrJ/EryC1/StrS family aminotransferase [Phycisphaerales bacterium]